MAFAVILPQPYAHDFYYLDLFTLCCLYGILVLGLNIIFGYTGQLALSHVGFWGIGAYVSALLTVDLGWWSGWAMALGMVVCAALAAPLGIITRNLAGHYLALATLVFTGIVQLLLLNWVGLTKGPNGIGGIPPLGVGGFVAESPLARYYLMLAALIVVAVFTWRWQTSCYGRRAAAMKRSELAARSLGVDTSQLKVVSLMVSAAIASFAGSLYAHYLGYVSPDVFGFAEMFKMVTMIIIGGLATVGGPIVGAALLVMAPEWFRGFQQYWQLIYAVLLLVLVLRMPYGIWGLVLRLRDNLRHRRRDAPSVTGKAPHAPERAEEEVKVP
ncbi:branched-chain amino acid ABC transporter permease [Nocardioides terrisoli]|uniref:branched-chain amino acid ABC transporter permease n=1 Tax=Nocardioides terrisoli TaxID=3388267 RepID=UPI00287BAB76|nr:branched-chain amino acid ABC transporter permease [Nocardioides marmorisolisilvae]